MTAPALNDKAYKNKCLVLLLTDATFLKNNIRYIQPKFFGIDAMEWIFKAIESYYGQYKAAPTLMVLEQECIKITDPLLQISVTEMVKELAKMVANPPSDLSYVKDNLFKAIKDETIKGAMLLASMEIKEGNYDAAYKCVKDAYAIKPQEEQVQDYFADFDTRVLQCKRNPVSTQWKQIDMAMDGGLSGAEIGVIVSPTNNGKSWILARLAAEAYLQKKNVMYFTLELTKPQVGNRLDAYFSNRNSRSILSHIPEVKATLNQVNNGCKFMVSEHPMKTLTVTEMENIIDRKQDELNIKFDIVIIDYADLLLPSRKGKEINLYNELGVIYMDIKALSQKLNIPVWTASQTNRQGYTADVLDMDKIGDSVKKVEVSDFMLSFSTNIGDQINRYTKVSILKNRFGPKDLVYPALFDVSTGHIEVFGQQDTDGANILNEFDKYEENRRAKKKTVRQGEEGPGINTFRQQFVPTATNQF